MPKGQYLHSICLRRLLCGHASVEQRGTRGSQGATAVVCTGAPVYEASRPARVLTVGLEFGTPPNSPQASSTAALA